MTNVSNATRRPPSASAAGGARPSGGDSQTPATRDELHLAAAGEPQGPVALRVRAALKLPAVLPEHVRADAQVHFEAALTDLSPAELERCSISDLGRIHLSSNFNVKAFVEAVPPPPSPDATASLGEFSARAEEVFGRWTILQQAASGPWDFNAESRLPRAKEQFSVKLVAWFQAIEAQARLVMQAGDDAAPAAPAHEAGLSQYQQHRKQLDGAITKCLGRLGEVSRVHEQVLPFTFGYGGNGAFVDNAIKTRNALQRVTDRETHRYQELQQAKNALMSVMLRRNYEDMGLFPNPLWLGF